MMNLSVLFNIGCEERQEKQLREEWSLLQHQKFKVFASLESTDVFKNKLKKIEDKLFQENSENYGKRPSS